MPFRINGIGLWHVGRKNSFASPGRCESCNAFTNLQSYDTRNWITIVFIPVVPLNARRVINHCPSCDRFHMLPLKQWLAAKAEAAGELDRVASGAITDPAMAMEAIRTAASFQDPALLDDEARAIAGRFQHSAPVLRELAEVSLYFGDTEAAQDFGEQALEVEPDDDTHVLLGRVMLAAGNLDDARACLDRILSDRLIRHAPCLTTLVQAYQAEGQHAQALELIGDIEEVFPEAGESDTVRKLKRVSVKHQRSGKRVAPSVDKPRHSLVLGAGAAMFAFVLLLGLAFVAIEEWRDASVQDVYFVNGLNREYDVEVAGQRLTLPAKAAVRWDLPGGPAQIKASLRTIAHPEVEIEVPGTVWSRFGREDLFIVNLDRVAVLDWEKFGYADDNLPNRDARLEAIYEYKPYVGELTYEIAHVDYPFIRAPSRLELDSPSDIEERTELMVDGQTSDDDLAFFVRNQFGEEAGAQFAERLFRFHRSNSERLRTLFSYAPEERFLELAFSRMAQGDVEYHRALQEYAAVYLDDNEIRARYVRLLEEKPDDADRIYLVGRTYDNGLDSRPFFLRATEGLNPSSYAYNALAYGARAAGRFQEGLGYAREALALEPRNAGFVHVAMSLALAAGDYGEVERLSQTALELVKPSDRIDFDAMRWQVIALCRSGRTPEAKMRIDEMADSVRRDFKRAQRDDAREAAEAVQSYLNEVLEYATCGGERLDELCDRYENELYRFERQLTEGTFDDLAEILEAPDEWSWDVHLMFAIGAQLHGRSEANQLLEHATESLAQFGGEHAEFASLLDGSSPLDPERVAYLSSEPSAKTLVLAALLVFRDDAPESLADLARALNYELYVPTYLIEHCIGNRRSQRAAAL